MEQFSLQLGPIRKVYGVAELTARIRVLLDSEFGDVWVTGEISGTRLASSGHYYFTLKDGESQIKCACFRMNARYLKFKPRDGVAVTARGRIDVYEARGEY
ncbi:MAG: exodeoxyribonuclease VII large subunit, partial [Bryobacteraceae bacterium]|nr:exodeoxyribonuclease VII large subunit [Bryobacteraceae bacterium]